MDIKARPLTVRNRRRKRRVRGTEFFRRWVDVGFSVRGFGVWEGWEVGVTRQGGGISVLEGICHCCFLHTGVFGCVVERWGWIGVGWCVVCKFRRVLYIVVLIPPRVIPVVPRLVSYVLILRNQEHLGGIYAARAKFPKLTNVKSIKGGEDLENYRR
jgi:hypothetical protein